MLVLCLSGVLDPAWPAACPSFVFGKVAVVSKPIFYGRLRAGVFTKCFWTATKILDSCGLFPAEFWSCFAVAVAMAGYPAEQVPLPSAEAMLRYPQSLGSRAWPGTGEPSSPGWGGAGGSPWAQAAVLLVQVPAFSHSRFFCLKSLKLHCGKCAQVGSLSAVPMVAAVWHCCQPVWGGSSQYWAGPEWEVAAHRLHLANGKLMPALAVRVYKHVKYFFNCW